MAKVEQLDMLSGVAAPPAKVVEDAQAIWNEHAKLYRWKACKVLDRTRQAAIKRAVGDYGGIAGWRESLANVAKNRFVQGLIAPREGYKQFVANIDWFCRPVTVRKVLEDFYEDEGADSKAGGGSTAPAENEGAKWGRWLHGYRPGRFWPTSSQGPRPEDPGCRAPPDLLQWWREQNKVTAVPVVQETRATRLAASIVSYRRLGNHGRANELEEDLAKLENRPAVLVPAPDVAHLTGTPREPRRNGTLEPHVNFSAQKRGPAATVTDVDPGWDAVPEGEEYDLAD